MSADNPAVSPSRIGFTLLALALPLVGGCVHRATHPGPLEPFVTVEPLDGGRVFVEVADAAAGPGGAVVRINDGPWATEGLARRGDTLEVARLRPTDAASTAYRLRGVGPRGRVLLDQTQSYGDGFPPQRRALAVRPYRRHADAPR